MTGTFLNFLLISAELVKFYNFVILTILMIIGTYYKKTRKFAVRIYAAYFGIFLMYFPINEYGADILTVWFLKKKLTPKSFVQFRQDINSKKNIKEKIIFSHIISYDIKYRIKKLEKEISSAEKELKNIKGIEKNFIPWTDTTDTI